MEFVNGWWIIPYIYIVENNLHVWNLETTKQFLWEREEGNRVVMELPGTNSHWYCESKVPSQLITR